MKKQPQLNFAWCHKIHIGLLGKLCYLRGLRNFAWFTQNSSAEQFFQLWYHGIVIPEAVNLFCRRISREACENALPVAVANVKRKIHHPI
jgi:hypothetical protein